MLIALQSRSNIVFYFNNKLTDKNSLYFLHGGGPGEGEGFSLD